MNVRHLVPSLSRQFLSMGFLMLAAGLQQPVAEVDPHLLLLAVLVLQALHDLLAAGLGVVGRAGAQAARGVAAHSRADAEAWPRFRRELFDLARAMRPFWWDEAKHGWNMPPTIATLRRQNLAAWLDSRFESDALKAALACDASGLSPLVPGSPLLLVWRGYCSSIS